MTKNIKEEGGTFCSISNFLRKSHSAESDPTYCLKSEKVC